MAKKIAILLSVLVLPIMSGCIRGQSSLTPEKKDPIATMPSVINLGSFHYDKTENIQADFEIVATEPVTLIGVGKSCGCINVESISNLVGSTFEAGGAIKFGLPISLANQAGSLRRSITLRFLGHTGQEFERSVEIQYIVVQPPILLTSEIELEKESNADFAIGKIQFERLTTVDQVPLKLDYVKSDFGPIETQSVSVFPPQNMRTSEPMLENITVPVSIKVIEAKPDMSLVLFWEGFQDGYPVKATIVNKHPLDFVRSSLFLGMKDPGEEWEAKIAFVNRLNRKFSIEGIWSDFSDVPVLEIRENQFCFSGRFPNDSGRFERSVKVQFSTESSLPPITFQFSGVVKENR